MPKTAKYLWISLLAAAALLAAWQHFPMGDATARLQSLSRRGLLYTTRDLPLNGAEEANFKGTTVVKRLAMVSRSEVILTAIDGTRHRHAIHDPAFCFRGAGWQVVSDAAVALDHGEGRLLRLQQAGQAAEAIYWFSDGREQFASPMEYWWKTALRRLTLGHSGEEPVLVILSSTTQGTPDWPTLLRAWPDLQTL